MKLEWCSTQKTSMHWRLLLVAVSLTVTSTSAASQNGYYGKFIGKLRTLHHSVGGDVYAVDSKTLHIRNFNYDGEGPDAFFYAGSSKNPSGTGFRIRDEKGTLKVLGAYRKKHITLTLPEGKTLNSIKWFSIWCREFSVNFGHVNIPRNLDFPKPQKIGALSGIHGVSSDNIVVVDAQTLLIPNFSYDGEAPDAKFWVGRGSKPDANGIRVPDENGKELPLRRYDKKTIVLTLPGDLTVFDVDYMSVWCEAFTVDFAHVKIPKSLNVPPSLRMLGVSPQKRALALFQNGGAGAQNNQLFFGFPSPNSDPNNHNLASRRSYQVEGFTNANTFSQQPAFGFANPVPFQQQIQATTFKPPVPTTYKPANNQKYASFGTPQQNQQPFRTNFNNFNTNGQFRQFQHDPNQFNNQFRNQFQNPQAFQQQQQPQFGFTNQFNNAEYRTIQTYNPQQVNPVFQTQSRSFPLNNLQSHQFRPQSQQFHLQPGTDTDINQQNRQLQRESRGFNVAATNTQAGRPQSHGHNSGTFEHFSLNTGNGPNRSFIPFN